MINLRLLKLSIFSCELLQKHSPKIVNSFFHMVQVLIKRGLNFDELLRQHDEEGNGVIDKEHFIKVCLSLGLPFGVRSLSLVFNRFSVSSVHIDYEALLQEVYAGVSGGNGMRTVSDDSSENADVTFSANMILLELRRMLLESTHAFNKSFDDVYRMFSRWDVGGTGTVTATQFLRVLSHLHIVFSEQDQDLIVELFDCGGEGRVDFDSLLTFCFHYNSDFDAAQSPFAHKSYSYFGDDNTTSNSALSVGSVDNADTSVEKLDGPSSSPDMRQAKPSSSGKAGAVVDINIANNANANKPNISPEKNTARSNSSSFQIGRPRPHTAGGDKQRGDGTSSTGGGSNNRSASHDSESPMHRNGQTAIDVNSYGSNNGYYNAAGSSGNIESPTSRARRMVRPMTAAPRVPLTVSVPREPRSHSYQDMDVSVMDEFVVDVLSDDDVLDVDEDAMDLKSYEAATDREEARARDSDNIENIDDYNTQMKDERDLRQFKMAAAKVVGPIVYVNETNSNQGHRTPDRAGRPANDIHSDSQRTNVFQDELHHHQTSHRQHVQIQQDHDERDNRRPASSGKARQQESQYTYNSGDGNYPPTHRAEPGAALKMLRRDIIHRHQKSGKTLYDIFRTFDVLGNRYFYAGDLQRTMMELALPIDDYQAAEMIKLLALDGEDRICFAEFAVFITDPEFPILADRVQRLVADNYEKQGREYQLKLYNITMHAAASNSAASSSSGIHVPPNGATAITGFISKVAFESALTELGLVASGDAKSDKRGPITLLNSVEVSRLCVRFDTHGRDLCSVAKFLREVQHSAHWHAAEQNVVFMEEAAEEAQTAREELQHYPSGVMTVGPPPGHLLNEEIIDMAEYLGIRVLSEPHLLQIVDTAVRAPVPEGWSIHTDKKGRNFFFHQRTGRSQWDHPSDDDFRRMRDNARAMYNNQRHNHSASDDVHNVSLHESIAGPVEQSRRYLRPLSAKGRSQYRFESAPGSANAHFTHAHAHSVEQERPGHQFPQQSPYSGIVFHDPRSGFGGFENPRLDVPRQVEEKQPMSVIGDAVVQAMQNMDPLDLLKILNKNGDLLSAIGLPKNGCTMPISDLTPLQNSKQAEIGMKRNNSAPVQQSFSGNALVMVPQLSSSASAKKLYVNGSKKNATTIAANSQKKTHPSYRHNGSGMFDPMRGDRERMQHKRTHNWTPPSAVDRALNVGRGFFGADQLCEKAVQSLERSSDRGVSEDYEEERAVKRDVPSTSSTYYDAAAMSEQTPNKIPSESNRPKSGSSIRRKIPIAEGSLSHQKISERPKTGMRSTRSAAGASTERIPGPAVQDIYGDKLLTRLDALIARHHSP